jgi:hypothetical protein
MLPVSSDGDDRVVLSVGQRGPIRPEVAADGRVHRQRKAQPPQSIALNDRRTIVQGTKLKMLGKS